jgi:hypothetical protein
VLYVVNSGIFEEAKDAASASKEAVEIKTDAPTATKYDDEAIATHLVC